MYLEGKTANEIDDHLLAECIGDTTSDVEARIFRDLLNERGLGDTPIEDIDQDTWNEPIDEMIRLAE